MICLAFEAGVRVFDTAPSYGAGEAERRLGRAIALLDRSKLFVSTKAGLRSHGIAGRDRDFSPDGIERSLMGSLNRLGVEGVDLLVLHGAAPHELSTDLLRRLQALKSAGALTAIGATGRGQALGWALETGWISHLMAPVHPFLNADERTVLQRAHKAGVRIIAIETSGDGPAPFRVPRKPSDLYTLAKRLRGRAGVPGRRVTMAEGLRAAMETEGVDTTLFTTTRVEHLHDNLALAGLS